MKSLIGYLYRKKMEMLPGIELGKFPPIRWIRDSWRRKVRQTVVEVEGHTIHVDPMDSLDLSVFGIYEPSVVRYLAGRLKEGDVAVDIGANIGHHTLFMARSVGSSGKVYAFEPAPRMFELLEKNVSINHYRNVTLTNKALLDVPREVKLFLSSENLGDHRVYESDEQRTALSVDGTTLDDFLQGRHSPVDLIKMDVQGAEMIVLKGMQRVLESNPNLTILMEFWPFGLSQAGSDPCEVVAFLQERGFRFWNVSQPDNEVLPPVLLEYARQEQRKHSERHLDLICKRK